MTSVSDKPVAGQILAGKYRIDRVIGEGAMGYVLGAFHLELEESVAIKWVRDLAVVGPHAIERFLREAKLCARLQSEHVVRVRDVARTETGAPFIVMELLDGHDLAEVVANGKGIEPALAVDYVIEACEAIAEAHQLGIVHRDLKLQNLFLARRKDGSDLVKVLDFGISKVTTSASLSMTTGTAILGSPLYMSPEQWRSSKDVDARSDIWSLGVVLFELLTGNVPFMADSLPELCMSVITAAAPLPSSLATGIPPELDRIVLACLEKDPAGRPPNIGALVRALAPLATDRSRSSRERIHRLQPDGSLPPPPRAAMASNVALPAPPPSSASLPIQTRTLVHEPSIHLAAGSGNATPSPAALGPPGSAATAQNWSNTGSGATAPPKSKTPLIVGGIALGLAAIGALAIGARSSASETTPASTVSQATAAQQASASAAPVNTPAAPEPTITASPEPSAAPSDVTAAHEADAGAPVQEAKATATPKPKPTTKRPTQAAATPTPTEPASTSTAVRDLGGSRR